MKRFYCALVLLAVIITSSIYLNRKIEKKAEELIYITQNADDESTICSWWDKNDIWFDALLHDDLIKPIYLNINKLKSDVETEECKMNIIINSQKIKDSVKLSIENIF